MCSTGLFQKRVVNIGIIAIKLYKSLKMILKLCLVQIDQIQSTKSTRNSLLLFITFSNVFNLILSSIFHDCRFEYVVEISFNQKTFLSAPLTTQCIFRNATAMIVTILLCRMFRKHPLRIGQSTSRSAKWKSLVMMSWSSTIRSPPNLCWKMDVRNHYDRQRSEFGFWRNHRQTLAKCILGISPTK